MPIYLRELECVKKELPTCRSKAYMYSTCNLSNIDIANKSTCSLDLPNICTSTMSIEATARQARTKFHQPQVAVARLLRHPKIVLVRRNFMAEFLLETTPDFEAPVASLVSSTRITPAASFISSSGVKVRGVRI